MHNQQYIQQAYLHAGDDRVRIPALFGDILSSALTHRCSACSPGSRVYWFFFVKLDKTHYGADIPRYTKKEEEEFAAKHASENVTEDVTFGDLYNTRISSVLTALPEYAFKKWHFGRIMTIGDAAHKVSCTLPALLTRADHPSLNQLAVKEATAPSKPLPFWQTT